MKEGVLLAVWGEGVQATEMAGAGGLEEDLAAGRVVETAKAMAAVAAVGVVVASLAMAAARAAVEALAMVAELEMRKVEVEVVRSMEVEMEAVATESGEVATVVGERVMVVAEMVVVAENEGEGVHLATDRAHAGSRVSVWSEWCPDADITSSCLRSLEL